VTTVINVKTVKLGSKMAKIWF